MADKEVTAQIDKLRKTRPARALDAVGQYYSADGSARGMLAVDLIAALSMLCDDLEVEARLVEQAKIKGGLSIMKDRLAVAGWLELFVIQLGRESETPGEPRERLSPSPELGEHRPSEGGTDAASLPGPGGRCAVGNVHDASTLKCSCGYTVTRANTGEIEAFLSGATDELPTRSDHRCPDCGAVVDHDTSNVACPNCARSVNGIVDALPNAAAYIGDALEPRQRNAHTAVDREYAHVVADPMSTVDPFSPIPRAVWAPTIPPNGKAWTTADLLTPVDATSLPAHLSFSQATSVVECGAKYRMQRIANVPQVPQWANVGGTTFHACVEFIEHNTGMTDHSGLWNMQFEEQIDTAEQSSGMTREQFRASARGREGYDWWRVEGAAMLQRYVDWRRGDGAGQQLLNGPDGAPMLEWATTYNVDGVPFTTILDSVWAQLLGQLRAAVADMKPQTAIIRDWKTGAGTPDNRQLCTQAWGLRKAGWKGPILAQFFDAREGTFSEPFDPFERMGWDDVRYFVLSADAQRRLPILPARPSDFCGGCSVAYACPIMAQRKTKR
jgi:hypothetical protein